MQTTIEGVDSWSRAAQRALHPSGATVGIDILSAIAAGLAAVTVPWELADGEQTPERKYQRVLATPAYEAWVICWPSGGSLDLHDHGGSAGAFSVVSGQLDEAAVRGWRNCRTHILGGRDDRLRRISASMPWPTVVPRWRPACTSTRHR